MLTEANKAQTVMFSKEPYRETLLPHPLVALSHVPCSLALLAGLLPLLVDPANPATRRDYNQASGDGSNA